MHHNTHPIKMYVFKLVAYIINEIITETRHLFTLNQKKKQKNTDNREVSQKHTCNVSEEAENAKMELCIFCKRYYRYNLKHLNGWLGILK